MIFIFVLYILIVLFGNWDVEWWNIVFFESFDLDVGYDDGVCGDEDFGNIYVGDLIDGVDLFKEFRILNNV